jgi:hypothetical protein
MKLMGRSVTVRPSDITYRVESSVKENYFVIFEIGSIRGVPRKNKIFSDGDIFDEYGLYSSYDQTIVRAIVYDADAEIKKESFTYFQISKQGTREISESNANFVIARKLQKLMISMYIKKTLNTLIPHARLQLTLNNAEKYLDFKREISEKRHRFFIREIIDIIKDDHTFSLRKPPWIAERFPMRFYANVRRFLLEKYNLSIFSKYPKEIDFIIQFAYICYRKGELTRV